MIWCVGSAVGEPRILEVHSGYVVRLRCRRWWRVGQLRVGDVQLPFPPKVAWIDIDATNTRAAPCRPHAILVVPSVVDSSSDVMTLEPDMLSVNSSFNGRSGSCE